MKNDKDLFDQWLRDQLGQAGVPAPGADWDMPGDRVWLNIEAARKRKKKRRLVIFWWLGAAATLALLLAGYRLLTNEATVPIPTKNQPQASAEPATIQEKPAATLSPEIIAAPRTSPSPQPISSADAQPQLSAPLHPAPPSQTTGAVQPVEPHAAELLTANYTKSFRIAPRKPERKLPQAPIAPSAAPITPETPKTAWYIGATAGLLQSRHIQSAQPQSPVIGSEIQTTFLPGLLTGRNLGKGWFLETGLSIQTLAFTTTRKGSFLYRTDREVYDTASDRYQNSAEQELETGLGLVELRYEISRQSARPIFDRERFAIEMQAAQQASYLHIPLSAGKYLGKGRWQLFAKAGAALNLRTGYRMEVRRAATNRLGVERLAVATAGPPKGLHDAYWDLHAAAGVAFRANDRMRLRLGPEWQQSLTPLSTGRDNHTQHARNTAVALSAVWTLK